MPDEGRPALGPGEREAMIAVAVPGQPPAAAGERMF
jgi:hypothetical protein